MTLDEAKALYRRAKVSADLASPKWSRLFDHNAKRAQIGALDELTGQFTPIATLGRKCPYDDEQVLFHGLDYLRASIIVAEEAFRVITQLREELDRQQRKGERAAADKDYAAQCVMACDKPSFRQYLHDIHGVDVSDRERIANRVRTMLKIKSRAELNTDPAAAARWRDLVVNHQNWERGR